MHEAALRPLGVPLPEVAEDPLHFPGLAERLARLPAGTDPRAVEVGLLTLGDVEVVVARGRFDVLAGSMGRSHGAAVATALGVARERRLPFVALVASGGARVQEGLHALLQMARVAEGLRALRAAGVPALTFLGEPSTGGVLASYASLADVILADPAATVGFAGPRVVERVTGAPVGPDSHRGRTAFASGLVDGLTGPAEAPALLGRWAALLHPHHRDGPLPDDGAALADDAAGAAPPVEDLPADEVLRRTRALPRPSARTLLHTLFDDTVELSGDRAGGVDPVAVAGVGRLGQRSVVVVGTDREALGACGRRGMPGPAAYRTLRRALALASRHGLPVVSLIDTVGADPSPSAEHGGIAGAIAETFVDLLAVPGPTVAVVTGEGGSGGALALGAADRLLIQDDAFLSVIAPESAAAILRDDAVDDGELSRHLQLRPTDLHREGIVDAVLPGPTTAGVPAATAALRQRIVTTLRALEAEPDRLALRSVRYG
jgi:acetyl-CoA carboxylase carboxyl transferase subunit beta